tara:strand:+ start:814 stop:948 length:135 start_codon:yes stop_codon:yes gene_type:complete
VELGECDGINSKAEKITESLATSNLKKDEEERHEEKEKRWQEKT